MMGINVTWGNPQKTVILQRFKDPWTVEEHRASLLKIGEMVASQPHTVHAIADMTESGFAPARMMVSTRVAESVMQPNSGLLFIVQPTPVIKSIVTAARRFMPRVNSQLQVVATIDEARTIIEQYKPATR
ncbi:MAG: hypothetical protein AAF787_03235 [Chloroflexota bacterium]